MQKKGLLEAKRIHCVGVAGSGLSALAGILLAQGKDVSGSDIEASETSRRLEKLGLRFSPDHDKKNISARPDLLIHSLAVGDDNPEIREAKKRKISVISYPEAVGELTRTRFTITVCGTHGKSTTTAMIAKILMENGFDPTVIVGAKLRELQGLNFRLGKSKILVLEACEFERAFLHYRPRMILLHTLDPDHLDYYENFQDYLGAFEDFCGLLPLDGYFLGNLDDPDVRTLFQNLQKKSFPAYNTFAYSSQFAESDFYLHENKIVQRDRRVGELKLKLPGAHNRQNALAAFSACGTLGIAPRDIIKSLNEYAGAGRRFEIKGKSGQTLIIDDYAHHPAEIQATLQAAREMFPREKICVVFQPHQYSRTKKLLPEFAAAFENADQVVVPNIYAARDSEADKKSISAQSFVSELKKKHRNVHYGDGIDATIDWLKKNQKKFDVIMTMGAGDVWKMGEALVSKNSS